ncbi:MAG: ribosomal RNA small subunit methyltransferase H [Patescibacteria group bacterium]|nr:MAG: ribosomal RNA small subunit methyltransferase H [Patescibacteria group bacterium]
MKRGVHKPVLAKEIISFLDLYKFAHSKIRGKLIDATFGLGGYEVLMKDLNLDILGIEIDQKTLKEAKARIDNLNDKKFDLHLVQGNFRNILSIARNAGFDQVDAIIFDLGISSFQLESEGYGLSFKFPESPLDMRLDKGSQITAADLLNTLSQKQLESLFGVVLNRSVSGRVAREVVDRRKKISFSKVADLLDLAERVMGKKGKLHPATKIFLALRMAVNSELENLSMSLPDSFSLLKKNGRLAVVSFHSLEDRVVKNFFRKVLKEDKARLLTKKPVLPSEDEVLDNPRSRSAKLRVIEKII